MITNYLNIDSNFDDCVDEVILSLSLFLTGSDLEDQMQSWFVKNISQFSDYLFSHSKITKL